MNISSYLMHINYLYTQNRGDNVINVRFYYLFHNIFSDVRYILNVPYILIGKYKLWIINRYTDLIAYLFVN